MTRKERFRRDQTLKALSEAQDIVRRAKAGLPVQACRIPWAEEMIVKHGPVGQARVTPAAGGQTRSEMLADRPALPSLTIGLRGQTQVSVELDGLDAVFGLSAPAVETAESEEDPA